jgi:putative sporulation protein YtaF
MEFWALLFFACALSLDALSAGFAYGLRRIRIPFLSQIIFFGATTLTVGFSLACGHLASGVIPPVWGSRLGGAILLGIGIWWYLRRLKEQQKNPLPECEITLVNFKIASLAVIIKILDEPVRADMDSSGMISSQEAVFLGFALSLDAFGAGFGLAMAGANSLLAALLIGVFQQLFIMLGIWYGRFALLSWLRSQGPLLSSLVLCCLGLIRLLQSV